jgi:2,4-dienoyl-CoA reductase-like NADH-dependent reductase (Old Yellow Enzyme family)
MTSSSTADSRRLFTPLRLGNAEVKNRLALAPLTRFRAPDHVPAHRHAVYYAQRADNNLLITEGTFIAPEAGGYLHVP